MQFWNKTIETMPRKEIEQLQLRLLKELVTRIYEKSHYYHTLMKEVGVHPSDIISLEDIVKLPTMNKTDLRDNYPDRLIIADPEDIIRYHVSSGTTGKPTVVGYTKNDIENWSESLARSFTSFGLGKRDVIQVSNGYGLFSGGLGMHYGAEKLGAAVVPASTGGTKRQIELIKDLKVTSIACTPSYLLHMAEVAESMGVDFRNDTRLGSAILGAEPWSENTRRHIEDWMGIKAQNCYGASELSGPLFTECNEQDGVHVWGDLCLVEVIDPKTGEHVGEGDRGELVFTMLRREALPIIRYRIGDISEITWERCACGRTHPRLQRVAGRVDDMIIIRGINVFPSQVEHVLGEIEEVTQHYMILVDSDGALDKMTVQVELDPEAFTDNILTLRSIRSKVAGALKDTLNVRVDVELMEPGSLPRFEEKAKRVLDRRVRM